MTTPTLNQITGGDRITSDRGPVPDYLHDGLTRRRDEITRHEEEAARIEACERRAAWNDLRFFVAADLRAELQDDALVVRIINDRMPVAPPAWFGAGDATFWLAVAGERDADSGCGPSVQCMYKRSEGVWRRNEWEVLNTTTRFYDPDAKGGLFLWYAVRDENLSVICHDLWTALAWAFRPAAQIDEDDEGAPNW